MKIDLTIKQSEWVSKAMASGAFVSEGELIDVLIGQLSPEYEHEAHELLGFSEERLLEDIDAAEASIAHDGARPLEPAAARLARLKKAGTEIR